MHEEVLPKDIRCIMVVRWVHYALEKTLITM